jgi:hypothetical protein
VRVVDLEKKYSGLLTVRHLARAGSDSVLVDPTGDVLAMLGVESLASYIIRPDGHVSYRSGGANLAGAESHLSTLLAGGSSH